MGWGLSNLIRAAAGAAGGGIDVVGGGGKPSPGAALGTIEKINQSVGGAAGMASQKVAQVNGLNSFRSMGNILNKARVTRSSKVHFDQVQYPSYGDADIWGIAASLGGYVGKAGATDDAAPPSPDGALSEAAQKAIGMLSSGGSAGSKAASIGSKWGVSNIFQSPKTRPAGRGWKQASSPRARAVIRSFRNLDITDQIKGFESFTTAASFGLSSAAESAPAGEPGGNSNSDRGGKVLI
tara:strand:- start:399 stop:1112 length:714 start_codon:yes stop_codon:yes gene_type:complete